MQHGGCREPHHLASLVARLLGRSRGNRVSGGFVSASEKLKALVVEHDSGGPGDWDSGPYGTYERGAEEHLWSALPRIVAVVEAAETSPLRHLPILKAAIADLDEALT